MIRDKIILRPARAKPHIVPWYQGQWKCYSHNASAIALKPDVALKKWIAKMTFQRRKAERAAALADNGLWS